MQSARDMAASETDVAPLEAMYLNRCARAREDERGHCFRARGRSVVCYTPLA